MNKYAVRINGTGNAWPVPLGSDHPFYDEGDPEQLANASFSIIKSSSDDISAATIEWEVLIDAGHGIVQYLIRHGNRMPEAVVLTHAHLDHTLSLDWIMQSCYRISGKSKKMSLYSSSRGWEFISGSFPQLPSLTNYHQLNPGDPMDIDGIPELKLVPLPVYHGEKAPGPSMLVFELRIEGRDPQKLIFTGDVLCPLLRRADYRYLKDADLAFIDANNRFPYTSSNHWSIIGEEPDGIKESRYLREFRQQLSCTHLIASHLPVERDRYAHPYFDEFLAYCNEDMPLSVFDFCNRINPRRAMMVHYSGMEDFNHYDEDILNPVQLENWTNAEAERRGILTEFLVPGPGDIYEITGTG